ncbi:hypothetical protein ALO_17211 [Acetonema longum DSM 6540]|uniref:Uncharacterized protein n=1 Tax=Acetonema longum DSM 6540 TaxID=1009370 RepID=F7NMV9_9FIRM|nr:hypothetical protein ALO_17211 [Acetonema longum DSM 6540]
MYVFVGTLVSVDSDANVLFFHKCFITERQPILDGGKKNL